MQDLINDLNAMAKCPVCEKKYKKENATVLDIAQKRNAIHFMCDSCHISSLVFVSLDQTGLVGMGFLTDLIGSEAKSLFFGEVISSDQILELYDFFKNYK